MKDGTDLTKDQMNQLILVNMIFSSVSMITSIISIIICIIYRKFKNFVLELVMHLSFSTFLYGIPAFLEINHDDEPDNSCKFQAVFIIATDFIVLIWISLISISAYYILKYNKYFEKKITLIRIIFIIIAYGLPLIISLVTLLTDSLGQSGPWCWLWINNTNCDRCYIFMRLFYCLYWFFTLLNIFFIFKTYTYERNTRQNDEIKVIFILYTKNLIYYPIIQIICGIPRSINRTLNWFYYGDFFYILMLQIIFDSSQGFLFSISCIINNVALRRDFIKCCQKRKKLRIIEYSAQFDQSPNIEIFRNNYSVNDISIQN